MTAGTLSPAEASATVDVVEANQQANGMISWFEGGHCDPWNHVESAMALAVGGRRSCAENAYSWLRATQQSDGSWFNYYRPDGSVEDGRLDTNVCAYVAAGVWQAYLAWKDVCFVEEMWPTVERAIEFVLAWQRPDGELVWSLTAERVPESYALLTGSSSAYFSIRCAIAAAGLLGVERPQWELGAGRLRHAVAFGEERFAAKDRYAMDWYYPVLSGALEGESASERLGSRWHEFVMAGQGVRCVSDRRWVTAAETAECAMACLAGGRHDDARRLLEWVGDQRDPDGAYTTGRVYPERSTFPYEERSSYTAAAVVLADDALAGTSPTARFFLGDGLPARLDLEDVDGLVHEP